MRSVGFMDDAPCFFSIWKRHFGWGTHCGARSRVAGSHRTRRRPRGYRSPRMLVWDDLADRCCCYCGLPLGSPGSGDSHEGTIEHILPVSSGGMLTRRENIEFACRDCNGRRGSTPLRVYSFARSKLVTELSLWRAEFPGETCVSIAEWIRDCFGWAVGPLAIAELLRRNRAKFGGEMVSYGPRFVWDEWGGETPAEHAASLSAEKCA